MTPDYPLYIIDIRRFNNTEVFRTDVKYVFDFIRCSGNKEALWELVNTHEYYKQMDEDAFDVITKYTNSKELMVMRNCEEKEEKKDVCKAIKDLMETSKEVGISEGKIEGKIEDILEDLSCLGEVPQELLKKIKAESDMDTLRRWRKLASRATSLEEFVVNCDNTFSK